MRLRAEHGTLMAPDRAKGMNRKITNKPNIRRWYQTKQNRIARWSYLGRMVFRQGRVCPERQELDEVSGLLTYLHLKMLFFIISPNLNRQGKDPVLVYLPIHIAIHAKLICLPLWDDRDRDHKCHSWQWTAVNHSPEKTDTPHVQRIQPLKGWYKRSGIHYSIKFTREQSVLKR